MAISSAFPIVQGIEYSLVSIESKRWEDSVRAGGNDYLTTALQIWQGSKISDFADKAFEAAGLPRFSWAEKSIIYLTPVLLTVLKNTTLVPEAIQPVLTFFQSHLSNLYQIAAVVSSVALLFFGQPFFAISSLLILGIGFMDRNGWLPVTFRQFLHRYSQPLLIITGFVSGGIFDRVFAALNIFLWCANACLPRKNSSYGDFVIQQNLTPEDVIDFFNRNLHVKMNREFIYYNPFPPVPDIDIQCFIEKFDQINWAQHLPILRKKLRHDARFIERHRNPDLKTDQEIIDITKHSLQTFITAVKERRILEGEPADYEKLHNYLKIIAKQVEDQEDETIRTDIIFRLAVEGGGYCGPGKFEVAESVYAQTIGENPEIPFTDKVLYCLQDERNLWMQQFYFKTFTNNPAISEIGKVIDWQDVHNYNSFINFYGDEFGLRKAAADNDDTAVIDPLTKWMISHTLQESIQEQFWVNHRIDDQTQTLIDSIGTSKLPQPEFYDFWKNWIARQQIEESEKEALREELATGNLYNNPIEVDGKITSDFITLMLLDMGIVERDLPVPDPLPPLQPIEKVESLADIN